MMKPVIRRTIAAAPRTMREAAPTAGAAAAEPRPHRPVPNGRRDREADRPLTAPPARASRASRASSSATRARSAPTGGPGGATKPATRRYGGRRRRRRAAAQQGRAGLCRSVPDERRSGLRPQRGLPCQRRDVVGGRRGWPSNRRRSASRSLCRVPAGDRPTALRAGVSAATRRRAASASMQLASGGWPARRRQSGSRGSR